MIESGGHLVRPQNWPRNTQYSLAAWNYNFGASGYEHQCRGTSNRNIYYVEPDLFGSCTLKVDIVSHHCKWRPRVIESHCLWVEFRW